MELYKYSRLQLDMVDCYQASQFYYKHCVGILAKKKARIYAGCGVLQTHNLKYIEEKT